MTYAELIEKALRGRSVNKAAHDMGITQTLLNKYKLGVNLPGFLNALILAKEAGVSENEAMRVLALEEAKRKGMLDQVKQVFRKLFNAPEQGIRMAR
ncbi:hypothetical protein OR16_34743 [Cupriavidus basilensis OR16]|uniref:HTH cro/C1-type domain-containing protein n=1 Tax=Cupriavidus basilensis OR16 TaxID=1127483 RepID=H1SF47_9BURK|nr:hypothetical protein [Cupriavidus basilensis]EHP38872.1 hypothetical protein OR16_34743 [Cupriavidus basilensis OR16]